MSTQSGKEVLLSVPAEAEYLDTIRLALYGIGVHMDFSYEAIEDLKVAVTEACSHALLQLAGPLESRLRIACTLGSDALHVRLSSEANALKFSQAIGEAGPLETDTLGGADTSQLGLYLMQALVDEVNVITGEGGGSEEIVLVKYREA